ncbi:hypothetical protein ACQY0O_006201 [Thecaphora frezii]
MAVTRRRKPSVSSDDDEGASSSSATDASYARRPTKLARKTSNAKQPRFDLASVPGPGTPWPTLPLEPGRLHRALHHRPRLLDDAKSEESLLAWFEGVSKKRQMPWRQDWIDPAQCADEEAADRLLRVRAYQVWISEIMLQQTRVETVKGYWTNWMSKWPTIEALAAANPDDVLSAWRGLGYYSRATRIHTAAQKVVNDAHLRGMLPQRPEELEKQVPGVGRYTAGAISSIVFGHAVPILDGNVARVLSRQMALHANPKAKETTDLLWHAADLLVRRVARNVQGSGEEQRDGDPPRSRIPGLWNQALMELGSTLCTPKPDCQACPIRTTCLAYAEGKNLALRDPTKAGLKQGADVIPDIEDICSVCEPIPAQEAEAAPPPTKDDASAVGSGDKRRLRQSTLNFSVKSGGSRPEAAAAASRCRGGDENGNEDEDKTAVLDAKQRERIEAYVRLFPMKAVKKQQRQEVCIVCVVRRPTSSAAPLATSRVRRSKPTPQPAAAYEYLIEQRPDSGLLASMWQFPSLTTVVQDGAERQETYADDAATLSQRFAQTVVRRLAPSQPDEVLHSAQLGSVAHVFSHLKLLMHVHLVTVVPCSDERGSPPGDTLPRRPSHNPAPSKKEPSAKQVKNKNFGSAMHHVAVSRWASEDDIEAETMGTGMRNCWALVRAQQHRS